MYRKRDTERVYCKNIKKLRVRVTIYIARAVISGKAQEKLIKFDNCGEMSARVKRSKIWHLRRKKL